MNRVAYCSEVAVFLLLEWRLNSRNLKKFVNKISCLQEKCTQRMEWLESVRMSPITLLKGCKIVANDGQFHKVLFTVRYTKRQLTALTFLPLTNNCPRFFCHYRNNNKSCQEMQNSLILKVKEWIQGSDSIQIWSRPA